MNAHTRTTCRLTLWLATFVFSIGTTNARCATAPAPPLHAPTPRIARQMDRLWERVRSHAVAVDVIAPVRQSTIVHLIAARHGATLTVDASSFIGKVDIIQASGQQAPRLVVIPDPSCPPAVVDILDGERIHETLTIYPVSVASELSTVYSSGKPPDPASRDYATFTQTSHAAGRMFNGKVRATLRRIQISGHRITIEPGGVQGIYERLMPGGKPADDVESVDIFAREVVIAGALVLPGSTVTVFAQAISFKDTATATASITTTPFAMPAETEVGKPAVMGEHGGDINLHIAAIDPGVNARARLIVTGGSGQMGGPPKGGDDGQNLVALPSEPQLGGILRSWGGIRKEGDGALPPGWTNYAPADVVWFRRGGRDEWGSKDRWPSNGKEGTPGGQPGMGGASGSVHSTLPLPDGILIANGGKSGATRGDAPGGRAGTPNPSVGIWIESRFIRRSCTGARAERECNDEYETIYHFYVHPAQDGQQLHAPGPSSPQGATGGIWVDLKGWLHPAAAGVILSYAEDLYRNGVLGGARNEFTWLEQALASADALCGPDSAYLPARQRLAALASRAAANLDYFGHPAGWVPELDFPALLGIMKSEAQTSALTILLTEQIRIRAEEGALGKESLSSARDVALQELQTTERELSDLADAVPQLQHDAATIASDEIALQQAIHDRETELAKEAAAKANPKAGFLQQALKTVGAIAKICPVGQPILGVAAGGLDLIASIGRDTPWDTLSKLPSVAAGFSSENISSSLKSYRDFAKDVNGLDPANPKELLPKLAVGAAALNKSISEFNRMQEASRAPASQVDAILQQLKAEDSAMTEWVTKASLLTARKLAIQQSIDGTMQRLSEDASEIANLSSSVDTLNTTLIKAQDAVDHPAVLAAERIGRLLRERLDYYDYLLIKSFEYFAAEPYQGNTRAATTAEALLSYLRSNDGDVAKAKSAFQVAYMEQTKELGKQLVQKIVTVGGGQEKAITFSPSVSETVALNKALAAPGSSPVYFDLQNSMLIPVDHFEARIKNIEVASCACRITAGGAKEANIQFDIVTPQEGVIRRVGQTIGFRRLPKTTEWATSVDITGHDARITPIRRPDDIAKILAALFDMLPQGTFIAAPPALPGIYVRPSLNVKGVGPGTVAHIDRMTIRVTYTYVPSAPSRAVRVVTTGADAESPIYYVSAPDEAGLRDGVGAFTRVYMSSFPIQIVAAPAVGTKRFIGWFINDTRVAKLNRVDVPVGFGSYVIEGRYGQ
jgi:hypothetical protein